MTEWIPVTERLPESETRVLTFAPGRYCPIDIHYLRHYAAVEWWIGGQNFEVADGDVTHWMPLPQEPE